MSTNSRRTSRRRGNRFVCYTVPCVRTFSWFVPQMNDAITDSALYKKILAFVLDEGIPDKKAKTYALKMTLDFIKSQASA